MMSTASDRAHDAAPAAGQARATQDDRGDDRQLQPDAGVDRRAADLGQQDEPGEAGQQPPRATKPMKMARLVRMPASRAAVGLAPIAYIDRPYVV